MTLLTGIVLGNIAMALLAAVLMWRSLLSARDLKAALVQTQQMSATDPLTGLPNRSGLLSRAVELMAAADTGATMVVLDLDGFKMINDTLGHQAGDELLGAVGERLRACLGEDGLLARLGGDEFAALFSGPEADADAVRFIGCAEAGLARPLVVSDDVVTMTLSAGVAVANTSDIAPAELLRRADIAMYVAKSARHTCWAAYDTEMDESLQLRRTISAELEAALTRNELQLVYQPLVCTRTGQVMSAEALMRWPGKEGRAGSPGVFIPIAEETGLILKLGEWVLDQACIEIKRQKTIPIAVNVSPVQFRVDGFAESVEAAIQRHGINPELLRIEITEGVLISHTDEAQRTMRRLRDLGVQVLLDDFGTGYSSLSYLQKFEFDGLKIDRAFIQQLEDGATGRRLLQSIISLGHSLNLKVVAEGVETEDQAALLQLLRCDFLQGYALGRPDTAEKLHALSFAEMLPLTRSRAH
ncbi:MAG: bifunctional diguanylate cyclase/phosphodiesterase [Hyphomonas sp.]|uniref:putative bifunctional diguanylate cyclase/phosphodiesterase n=1 Tax=Hyphomonas sp. TaxID=87 RepID=UPI0035283A1E